MSGGAGENPFASPMASQAIAGALRDDLHAQGRLDAKSLELAFQAAHSIWPSAASLIGVGLCIMLGAPLLNSSTYMGIFLLTFPAAFYCATVALTRYVAYRHPRWQSSFQRVANAPELQKFEIDSEFLKMESPSFSANLKWSQLSLVGTDPTVIVLALERNRLIVLPIYFFNGDDDFHTAKGLASSAGRSSWSAGRNAPPPLPKPTAPSDAIVGQGIPSFRETYACNSQLEVMPPHIIFPASLLLGCVALGALNLANLKSNWGPLSVAILAGSFAFLFLLDGVRRLPRLLARYRRRTRDPDTKWIVTADQVVTSSDHYSEKFLWQDSSRLLFRNNHIIAIFQRNYSLAIARRFFESEEDWRQVVAWARERKGDARSDR